MPCPGMLLRIASIEWESMGHDWRCCWSVCSRGAGKWICRGGGARRGAWTGYERAFLFDDKQIPWFEKILTGVNMLPRASLRASRWWGLYLVRESQDGSCSGSWWAGDGYLSVLVLDDLSGSTEGGRLTWVGCRYHNKPAHLSGLCDEKKCCNS